MDTDAEFDPYILRDVGVLPGHAALDFHSAARCIHRTGELHQHTVAGGLDNTAATRGDGGIDEGFSYGLELGQRAFLIQAHQTAISGNVCCQHSRQSSLRLLSGQKSTPKISKFRSSHQSMAGYVLDRSKVRYGCPLDRAWLNGCY
jgi:hypothetical protein